MTLAARLAAFAAGSRLRPTCRRPSWPACDCASLDILGIALAASAGDDGAVHRWAPWKVGTRPATARSSDAKRTAAAPLAILANGALAHGLDFDDTHAASITHASAVVVPAALALGEAAGRRRARVVTACVAGYEAITRLGMAAPGAFHARGWHATGVCGPFAAALVAGRIEGLDADRLTAALGHRGQLRVGRDGVPGGRLVGEARARRVGRSRGRGRGGAGRAEASPGRRRILEGRFGLYRTFLGAEPGRAPRSTRWVGSGRRRDRLQAVSLLPLIHAYLDCALALRHESTRSLPRTIEAVECRVPAGRSARSCASRARPSSGRARPTRRSSACRTRWPARSLDGRVGLDTYAAERLAEPRACWRWPRGSSTPSTPTRRFPTADSRAGCACACATGATLEAREPDGRGSLARPLPAEAIVEKFRDNAGRALAAARVAAIERAALSLDALTDVRVLTALCRG